ncbi:MAG: hypothetical protein JWO52_8210 [Gammaproteobacteria bacterium]|nr:hypothetical protein [Gammaproteobacteria bacterium]
MAKASVRVFAERVTECREKNGTPWCASPKSSASWSNRTSLQRISNACGLGGDRRTLGLRISHTSCWMWGRPLPAGAGGSAFWRGAARYSEANGRSRTDPAAASTGCRGSVRHRPGSCLVRMGRIRASLGRRITVINSERRARRPGRSPTLTPVMLVQHAQGRREMGTKGVLRHATRSRRRSWTSALS